MKLPRPVLSALLAVAISVGASGDPRAAEPRRLALSHVALDLPGPPTSMVPADMDGDGLEDLVVALVYTEFGPISFDRVEGFVQMTEIVPALFDRRELRVYAAQADGGYRLAAPPLPLTPSVHTIEAGPTGMPVVALTDEGVSALRLRQDLTGPGRVLRLEPVIAEVPVLAGSGSFLPGLTMMKDLDGDGRPDILFPSADGPAVFLDGAEGPGKVPVARLTMPGDEREIGRSLRRRYPLPEILDVDGDRRPDLVLIGGRGSSATLSIMRGAGGGRFLAPRTSRLDCLRGRTPNDSRRRDVELGWFGDIDGDGRAEAMIVEELESDHDGLKEAKQPHQRLSFHRLGGDLTLEPEPFRELEVVGYPFGSQWPEIGRTELKDLDGDGRKDLVTVTLDFSLFQILHVMATKRFSMGLQFHVWAQGADGRFTEVEGLDLSEKLTLDLNNLKLGRFAQFNGDFDGDGRADFVHLGRGRTVTIHLGQPGCRYGEKPDLAIDLAEEPKDIGLVQVRDLDGDGRSDLAVTRPLEPESEGASAPVVLDLYLSRTAR